MADTYIINASNQTVTGTAAGGKDTIKAGTQSATQQTIDAVVTGLNSSSRLDFGDTYGDNFFYFSTQPDGIHITNENGAYKFKLLGVTNTSICTGDTKNIFRALQQTTPWDDYRLGGNCTLRGDNDNDVLICSGSNNVLQGGYGNDIVINTGNNATLHGEAGDDILICGGTNNTLTGGDGNDAFEIYSYTAGGSNTTLTGGNGNNAYIMSTGLVGVDGSAVGTAPYNPNFNDTVNVTITDAESGDSYYMRDWGIYGINASTKSDGVIISSTSGRITVTMKDQRDWNAVKDNLITLDNAQGYVGTYTLEQAVGLAQSGPIPPAGVFTNGDYLMVSSSFVGNLIMSTAGANYTNNQIVTMDATQNYQVGMQLGGNGEDTFLIGKGDGSDAIFNAGNNDLINLHDVTLDDIASAVLTATIARQIPGRTCDTSTLAKKSASRKLVGLFACATTETLTGRHG